MTPAELAPLTTSIRRSIITMLAEAGSGHPGGALGMADVFATLYFSVLQHNPLVPDWVGRDRVILSNGHICPVLYAALAEAGYFPKAELLTLRKLGSRLQGHPHRGSLPGVENTSGPLGLGLSQAAGLACSLRLQNKPNHVYCVLSDGEHDEGQTWEAYLFAAKEKLPNLTAIIDRNNIQIDGRTEDVMPLDSLTDKISSFGWQVIEIDGHNFEQIEKALRAKPTTDDPRPIAVVCRTIPGKGVDFMENRFEWHGKAPSKDEARLALEQLH
jgi:transketolase